MICVIILCGLFSIIGSAPIQNDVAAEILSFENTNDGKGNYKFSFKTSNGIFRDETGTVVNEGQPDQYIRVQGFISFTDPDGNIQKFSYVANENGYEIIPETVGGMYPAPAPPHVVASLLG